MKKIDKNKQYRFSEIIRMIEDKELPAGTKIQGFREALFVSETFDRRFGLTTAGSKEVVSDISASHINATWTIEEKLFYMRLKCAKELDMSKTDGYLYRHSDGTYCLSTEMEFAELKEKYTQEEIDDMPAVLREYFKQIEISES